MKTYIRHPGLASLAAWLLATLLAAASPAHAEPVTLTAADGVKVYGEFQAASVGPQQTRPPLIIAFHQADASSAEYKPLMPRLASAGFSVLAIDQRSGGDEFDGENKTVAALGRSSSYEAALQDMEAALAWGKAKAGGAPVLVWGSSYSAALAFVLAARHPADMQAVLAFSPGEYLGNPKAVATAAQKVSLPVFIDQASDKDELAASWPPWPRQPATRSTSQAKRTACTARPLCVQTATRPALKRTGRLCWRFWGASKPPAQAVTETDDRFSAYCHYRSTIRSQPKETTP